MLKLYSRSLVLVGFLLTAAPASAQTWTTLANRPPSAIGLCMLLTDGTLMCQATNDSAWYKLTPNSSGSYINGTWSTLASLPSGYAPDAFASAVLADGRVAIVGGEYNGNKFALTNMGAVYDPAANTWTMINPPPSTGNPNHWQCIGDAPAVVLADGRLMVGSKLYQDVAVLDPTTMSWSWVTATGKIDGFNSEEGWTLLPDGSFFTLDVKNAPASERFLLSALTTGQWFSSGNTPQDLHTPTTSSPITAPGCPTYNPPGEIGPTLLRPDGTVFAVGADGLTAVYTPPAAGSGAPGTWAQGPAYSANVEDGPGAVLPSGHVLFGSSPGDSGTGLKYFEFDGTSLISVPAPARASSDATYFTSLLLLPTGQVLFVDSSTTLEVYTPGASPTYNPAWAPAIVSGVPLTINNGQTYQVFGTQFNGLDGGSAYGDESQNATNYPLVRITNDATGHVFYAKTHGHSSMGVATGSTAVSTNFDVPGSIEAGASTIQVIANGIPSAALPVTVAVQTIATSTTLSPSANPSVYSQPVTFTAIVSAGSGVPAGTVTFYNGSSALGTSTLNASGHATLSVSNLPVGGDSITATYNGNAAFSSSTSGPVPQTVNQDATTSTVTSSHNPSKHGHSVTFTAKVTAKAPGTGAVAGSVTFKDGTGTLGTVNLNSSGQASFSTSTLATGTHQITVVYGGNSDFLSSTSAVLTETIN